MRKFEHILSTKFSLTASSDTSSVPIDMVRVRSLRLSDFCVHNIHLKTLVTTVRLCDSGDVFVSYISSYTGSRSGIPVLRSSFSRFFMTSFGCIKLELGPRNLAS